jgi:hypothetical protein
MVEAGGRPDLSPMESPWIAVIFVATIFSPVIAITAILWRSWLSLKGGF